MKFKKKPVVIEAVQLTKDSIKEAYEFVYGPTASRHSMTDMSWRGYEQFIISSGMSITTLEDGPDGRAKHVATIGDWIIKGIKGEFYPCKPDIFEATYEPVKESDLCLRQAT